ncbi:hypothetical protein HPB52_006189 [Rhipicephalus sanguineus]|uniref:Eukaryotic translation initiation factor 4E type 3 n=1 Tax=Rhipicephalus sanguineus TaxID=34632 RepID=A0A9D4QES5_RHISA|nr:hypothetical protein HPB52_006189 [Rhipicephalus sanguineus]
MPYGCYAPGGMWKERRGLGLRWHGFQVSKRRVIYPGALDARLASRTEGRGISAAEYTASLKKIYTVNTVQGFWAVLHHIPDVCELGLRHTYHLMRGQRRPLWEDPENQRGGTWRIRCHKKHTPAVWKELILAAIGEQFAEDVRPGDDICGVSVCVREKDDIVQLWNADAHLSEGATVLSRVHALLPPGITPVAEFYKLLFFDLSSNNHDPRSSI